MLTRVVAGTLLALAAGWAQDPPPGRGPRPGGHFGPGFEGARVLGAEAGMPGRVVKNAPYSADLVTESTQTLADGNHIRQSTTAHLYRDSEGRTRREESLGGLAALGAASSGGRTQVVFINDPVGGANYALNPANKSANKSAWMRPGRAGSLGEAAGRMRPPEGPGPGGMPPQGQFARGRERANMKTESLGTQTIEGLQAQGTRTTFTIAANAMGNEAPIQIVSERWYSADLQMVVLSKRSDPRTGETVTRLTNINRSEPSAALFQIPADYKVSQGLRPNRQQPPASTQQ